jgi:hypothetical protein
MNMLDKCVSERLTPLKDHSNQLRLGHSRKQIFSKNAKNATTTVPGRRLRLRRSLGGCELVSQGDSSLEHTSVALTQETS